MSSFLQPHEVVRGYPFLKATFPVECTANNGCSWERLTEGIEESTFIVHHDGLHLHLGHVQQLHLDTISQLCVAFFLLGRQQGMAFSMLARPVWKTIWLKRVLSVDLKVFSPVLTWGDFVTKNCDFLPLLIQCSLPVNLRSFGVR
jgi:hypothetical protein